MGDEGGKGGGGGIIADRDINVLKYKISNLLVKISEELLVLSIVYSGQSFMVASHEGQCVAGVR